MAFPWIFFFFFLQGNVANAVETEQILKKDFSAYSFLQYRGGRTEELFFLHLYWLL